MRTEQSNDDRDQRNGLTAAAGCRTARATFAPKRFPNRSHRIISSSKIERLQLATVENEALTEHGQLSCRVTNSRFVSPGHHTATGSCSQDTAKAKRLETVAENLLTKLTAFDELFSRPYGCNAVMSWL